MGHKKQTLRASRHCLLVAFLATAGLLASARTASAHDFVDYPNEFSIGIGGQAGWEGWAPAGGKLMLEYGYLIGGTRWFNMQLNFISGDRWGDKECEWANDWEGCGYHHKYGSGIELVGGHKWKIDPWKSFVVPHFKTGIALLWLSYPSGIDAIAVGGRVGIGIKFFLVTFFGIGVETNLTVGVGYGDQDTGADLYVGWDNALSFEFIF